MVRSVVVGPWSSPVIPMWLMGLWGYVCGLSLVVLLVAFPPAGPSPSQSLENSLPKFLHAGSRSGEGCVDTGNGGFRVLLVAGL